MFLAPVSSVYAFLPGPFGGQIIGIRPCINFSAWQVIVGPPAGGSFIFQTGISRPYLYGPPRNPLQYLLGVAGGQAKCDLNPSDTFTGQLIRLQGSSLR